MKKILFGAIIALRAADLSGVAYPYVVPPLPYAYEALEPFIDTETMHIHHDKHHQKYVDELNKALHDYPELQQKNLEDLVKNWQSLPTAIKNAVRNNAGGHLNHSQFWTWMTPHPKPLEGKILEDITTTFGGVEGFKKLFKEASLKVFGSGWAWLIVNNEGKLAISTTSNQDNPITEGLFPILGLDVWEHAYYLKYQNQRADYLTAWWNVVNWVEVSLLYQEAIEKINQTGSGVVIIPGVTGDLAKRKLIPALYHLMRKGMRLVIIGTGRGEKKANEVLDQARGYIKDLDDAGFKKLSENFVYHKLDVSQANDFQSLKTVIQNEVCNRNLSDVRVVHMALPPDVFCDFTQRFVDAGVIEPKNKNHRILYEKPFGQNGLSAQKINVCIAGLLSEEQIYRIDHYLAKSLILALPSLREENAIFRSVWDNKTIESIDIILNEERDIGGRGDYYDQYGVLKDVIQNHGLQLVAVTLLKDMQYKTIEARAQAKAKILANLRFDDGNLGQYEGYRKETGVAPHSRTDTYAVLKLWCDLPQWRGVPIRITAGKALDKNCVELIISFKNVNQLPNRLVLRLSPREEILLSVMGDSLQSKQTEVRLASLPSPFGNIEAYQTLLAFVIKGDRSLTVSIKEIYEQWKLIDAIEKKSLPVVEYKKGSAGPDDSRRLVCYM